MKAEDFYQSLSQKKALFSKYGFKKRNRNTYYREEGVILKFLLDKWPWDELYGSGYQARLVDEMRLDKYGNTIIPGKDQHDIKIPELINKKLVSKKKISKTFEKYPKELKNNLDFDSFRYYDEKNLIENLDLFLEPILIFASEWTESRSEIRKTLPDKSKRPSQKELEESKKMIDDLFSDFK